MPELMPEYQYGLCSSFHPEIQPPPPHPLPSAVDDYELVRHILCVYVTIKYRFRSAQPLVIGKASHIVVVLSHIATMRSAVQLEMLSLSGERNMVKSQLTHTEKYTR